MKLQKTLPASGGKLGEQMSDKSTKSEILRVFELQKKFKWSLRQTTAQERREKLKKLKEKIFAESENLYQALWQDYKKPREEADLAEVLPTIAEIHDTIKNLPDWMRPKVVETPIHLGTARSEIHFEPLGQTLIIAPWNYPFNLSMAPLISAIAAGNTVMLKPSELAPHTAEFLSRILKDLFYEEEVAVFQGDASISTELLKLPFDHMFFTGSPNIGKVVMKAAAEHLSVCTLELGGKSPAIVENSADIREAGKRIAWGKWVNAGQTCIAPDYVLVSEDKKMALIDAIHDTVKSFYGQTPIEWRNSPDFCRIVNRRHFDRVKGLLDDAKKHGAQVAFGADTDEHDNYISPTVITDIPEGSKILEEEIFGPLLPIVTYRHLDEALEYIRRGEKPLALYVFSSSENAVENVLRNTAAGGTSVNDCLMQFVNPKLPFGGCNNSGLGRYHGHHGFKAFSHERAVFKQSRLFNPMQIFYPPYGGQFRETFQKFIRHIM
jgi:aldehyde dehydrogenase (NAD+)